MSSPAAPESFMAVRLVVADHYMASPVADLDPLYSDFRGYDVRRVPVIRVFGATPAGQRTCLHVHGVFPYIFVPMPEGEDDGFVYRLASSLDRAVNMTMNQSTSKTQHVYKAVKVTGRPFYGYHSKQHTFVKLYFYNPRLVKRAAELLVGGAVMNQVLQPHESHIPFELQFMMDYNLQGMNLLHLSHVLFRQGSLHDEYDDLEPFFDIKEIQRKDRPIDESLMAGQRADSPHLFYMKIPRTERLFHTDKMPLNLLLPPEVSRTSSTELEADCVAADILNHNDLTEGGMNPGLRSLWVDEAERRRQLNITEPLTPPGSPPRPPAALEPSASELFWMGRFHRAVEEKLALESACRNGSVAQQPDADSLAGAYPAETPDAELSLLPGATKLERHVSTLSDSLLAPADSLGRLSAASDDAVRRRRRRPSSALSAALSDGYADETVVDESLVASQMMEQTLVPADQDLVDMLAELAADNQPPARDDEQPLAHSPRSPSPKGEKSKLEDKVRRPSDDMFVSSQNSLTGASLGRLRPSTPNSYGHKRPGDEDEVGGSVVQTASDGQPRELTPQEQEVEEETAEMSQIIWDSDPLVGSEELLRVAAGLDEESRRLPTPTTGLDSSLWDEDDDDDDEFFEKLSLGDA